MVTVMYAGIETGGTKTVCAVGENGRIAERIQFPTGDDPDRLIEQCLEFLSGSPVAALGVGTFGPCDPDPASPTYGHILNTPKPGWSGVDLLGRLADGLQVPCAMTTDVNAAALAESRYGAAAGTRNLVYLTIGTGIGGGAVIDGRLVHGALHPEMGHLLLPQSHGDGLCPFHGNCFEGLASGPALQARLGRPAQDIPDDDPAWQDVADIVASGLHDIVCVLSPQRIVVGGGVGSRQGLHRHISGLLESRLAGYLAAPTVLPPGLGSDSGVLGAIALAQDYSQG